MSPTPYSRRGEGPKCDYIFDQKPDAKIQSTAQKLTLSRQ